MRRLVPLLVALLLVGAAGVVVSTPQSSEYSMTSPSEVEIPARNLTVDGEVYTVRAVARVDPGDRLRVDVSAPENAEYDVYLYNKDLRIEDIEGGKTGSARATFRTDALSPGSYFVAIYERDIVEVFPVVVEGYEVTADAPASADGEFTVEVIVADGALASDPPEVQVVLGDDERSVQATADRVSEGEYRATVPTDGFEPGTYALYGVVRGEETTEGGDRVILAVSDRSEVDIVEPMTPTPTAESDGGSDGGGGGGQPGSGQDGEVEVRDAALLNETVTTGERVLVRVDLANFDPTDGRITLALSADGTTVTERTVTVDASSERTIQLRTVFTAPGTYDLALDGEPLGTVTVTAAEARTADPAQSPTPTGTSTPTDEGVVTPRPTTAPSSPEPTTTSGDGTGFGAGVAGLTALAVALAALARGRRR